MLTSLTSTQDSELVKQIDEKLKEEQEPDLYKIISLHYNRCFENRRIAQNMMHVIAGITGATSAGVVGKTLGQLETFLPLR